MGHVKPTTCPRLTSCSRQRFDGRASLVRRWRAEITQDHAVPAGRWARGKVRIWRTASGILSGTFILSACVPWHNLRSSISGSPAPGRALVIGFGFWRECRDHTTVRLLQSAPCRHRVLPRVDPWRLSCCQRRKLVDLLRSGDIPDRRDGTGLQHSVRRHWNAQASPNQREAAGADAISRAVVVDAAPSGWHKARMLDGRAT